MTLRVTVCKILFFLSAPLFLVNAQNNWEWLHPWPQGNSLSTVKRISSTIWCAVGDNGTFIKTTDAGVTWTVNNKAGKLITATGRSAHVTDIHFMDPLTGIAVGLNGSVTKTTDGGSTWFEVSGNPVPDNIGITGVHFVSPVLGYISGTGGLVAKTTDGGNNWTILTTGLTTRLNDIWAPDDTIVVASTTLGSVIRSTDGGATWAVHSPTFQFGEFRRMAGGDLQSSNEIYPLLSVGDQGRLILSTDAGRIWYNVFTGYTADTSAMKDVQYKDSTWIISGFRDTVFISNNPWPLNFTPVDMSVAAPGKYTRMVNSAFASRGGDTIVTVGANGLIKFRKGANSPAQLNTRLVKTGAIQELWASQNSPVIIAVGDPSATGVNDQIIRSTDRGSTWQVVTLPGSVSNGIWSFDMIDEQTGFAGTQEGIIIKTTDAGATWSVVNASGLQQAGAISNIDFISPLTGWVFFSSGNTNERVYKTTDGGLNWSSQTIDLPLARAVIYNSVFTDSLRGWLATAYPAIFSTTDGGATWERDSLADSYNGYLFDVSMINSTTGFACGSGSKLYKTTNGGVLWTPLIISNLSESYFSLSQADQNRVVVAGSSGNCYFSYDGGQTWTPENTNVPGILISVYLTRNLAGNEWELYAAGTGGTILRNNFSVIPVELVSFSASVTDNKTVLLTWSTASETNNSGFEIERKTGNTWKKIGFVTGSGNSAAPKSYSFTDELRIISGGSLFEYRLKQIDFDGTSSYSGVVSVELNLMPENFELFQNYPNPFNPSTTIKYALPVESKVTIQIFNISGELIAEPVNGVLAAGYHKNIFDASNLPSGIYICKMNANALNNTGNHTAVSKMLLIK